MACLADEDVAAEPAAHNGEASHDPARSRGTAGREHCLSDVPPTDLTDRELWAGIARGSVRVGVALLQQALEGGSDLFARDAADGATCAHRAAAHGRGWELHLLLALERAARLHTPGALRAVPSLLHAQDSAGRTPLALAAALGHTPVVRYLLSAWADPPLRARDARGGTALHDAARGAHLEAVRLLLRAGADPAAPDADGCTPLALADAAAQHGAEPSGGAVACSAGGVGRGELAQAARRAAQTLRWATERGEALHAARPSAVAWLRCRAASAVDRRLTPLTDALADEYCAPPLAPRAVRCAAGATVAASAAALFAPAWLSVPAVAASVWACARGARPMRKRGRQNLQAAAAAARGSWLGCRSEQRGGGDAGGGRGRADAISRETAVGVWWAALGSYTALGAGAWLAPATLGYAPGATALQTLGVQPPPRPRRAPAAPPPCVRCGV
jgi:hypothetical protein